MIELINIWEMRKSKIENVNFLEKIKKNVIFSNEFNIENICVPLMTCATMSNIIAQ